MIKLSKIGSLRFAIQCEEWPQEAKRLGLRDPFNADLKQHKLIHTTMMIQGQEVPCMKMVDNPDAPPPASLEEKSNYRLEEEKFVIRRLIEEGCSDAISWDLEHCWSEHKEALAEYVKTIKLCGNEGQCSLFCAFYPCQE